MSASNNHTIRPEQGENNLLHNLLLFGRLLRSLGMDINPGRIIDLVNALDYVEIGNRQDFYHTLRSLLVHEQHELALFDRAFDLFWRPHEEIALDLDLSDLLAAQPRERQVIAVTAGLQERSGDTDASEQDDGDDDDVRLDMTQTYSDEERLRQKDFTDLTTDEVELVKRFMAELVWRLGQRQTRRFRPGRGARLDMRRSFRHSLRYGGEVLHIPRRQRKIKPRPLVVIADVSGSMERYTRLLLQFVYSLSTGLTQQVEAFVFSTRLTRITKELHDRELERALTQVSRRVEDWSGGTRIGEAIRTFNFQWARRVLGQGAVVILISDGWDRGDPELLGQEIARLQRHCHRLIWLNPLLGSNNYEPLTRGIQAALPHIDDFLPVHNLASLEDLAQHLAGLGDRRSSSRQQIITRGAAFVGKP